MYGMEQRRESSQLVTMKDALTLLSEKEFVGSTVQRSTQSYAARKVAPAFPSGRDSALDTADSSQLVTSKDAPPIKSKEEFVGGTEQR